MKLSVIALDYDGTIARGDVIDPAVRQAIAAARRHGITVAIVTGRILEDLRRVAGSLHFVDVVVCENGAVLHVPESSRTSVLAPPIPEAFLSELRRRGIPFRSGICLVDAAADEASRLLEVVRDLEAPLVLVFNAGRVMVLPQGTSKATGLRQALDTLRLSLRNTLAIGDAENDHELLRAAEIGMAVAWGSTALQVTADLVLPGDGPAAVAGVLGDLAASRVLPAPRRARRQLLLGHTDDGREFGLAVRGRNVLISGDAKSGKSWVAGLLCEQLVLHGYCLCIVDPEGDYRSLLGLPGMTVLGGEDPPPTVRDLLRTLRYPDRSVVIDLSHRSHDEKVRYVQGLLPALNVLRRRTGLPHRIVLDEAHYYLSDGHASELLDLDQNGYTLVTYRASQLPAAVLASAEVMLVTCESDPAEIGALRRACVCCVGIEPAAWDLLGHLRVGEAVALPVTDEAGGQLRRFTLAPRLTPHVRHREKYVDVPISPLRAFVFGDGPGRRARTLREFVTALDGSPASSFESYLARGDVSRWIRDVFGDNALASELAALEDRHRLGKGRETLVQIAAAIRARYDLVGEDLHEGAEDPGRV